ncbi:hypothetical protein [Streptomyces omiyaensis]|uniref:hypothetical protein n=1 Tax=Streptomyces omiyaensis TaxID=68247 RepID=UPI0036F62461
MHRTRLRTVSGDREGRPCVVLFSAEPPWTVEVVVDDLTRARGTGTDLFEALRSARRSLDEEGLLLCCNGARANARPSPTAAAAGAEVVHLVPRRRPATARDVVPLLAPAGPDAVVTVEAQERAWEARFASSRASVLSLLHPMRYVKAIEERVRGPVFWRPREDADGFTSWERVVRGRR